MHYARQYAIWSMWWNCGRTSLKVVLEKRNLSRTMKVVTEKSGERHFRDDFEEFPGYGTIDDGVATSTRQKYWSDNYWQNFIQVLRRKKARRNWTTQHWFFHINKYGMNCVWTPYFTCSREITHSNPEVHVRV